MLNFKKILGLDYYTSEIDKFLDNFDTAHPKLSASQQTEQKKYARINDLRDHAKPQEKQETFWDKF
ncbi:MAG TPA: CBU_0585 family protein [Gammaproteobacteria bacterium]|nr:CBU_0585 family protein [Gammaproteobacteria bacterium]